jgi:GTP-binding protein EngB required for normal cell division
MKPILDSIQYQLVADEQVLLEELIAGLERWEARPDAARRIREALAGLTELFLLVVTGEFNAGKSKLVNTLLGGAYLEEGVTPTTQHVQVLSYGPEDRVEARGGYLRRELPSSILQQIHVVDTPGTNAIIRDHESLTRDFIPRADLILFVTSADRPFSESERAFLGAIRAWGKHIVFVINKIDLLESAEDRAQVMGFVKGAATALLGEEPRLFPISARRAFRAQEAGDKSELADSGWTAFQDWIEQTLGAEARLRMKLESPLGVANKILDEAEGDVSLRLGVLSDDRQALDEVDAMLGRYNEEMANVLAPKLDRIDKQLMQLRERGEQFLEKRFRLLEIRGLLDGDKLRSDFESAVIAETPERIAREIDELIDWMVDREFGQWRSVRERLERQSKSAELTTAFSGRDEGFATRRRMLLDAVGARAESVISGFDPRAESGRLALDVQNTLASAGLAEAGALGLALLIKATSLTLMDPTGIAAGSLAVLGLCLVPYRRRQAIAALRERVSGLRDELERTLGDAAEREIAASAERMQEAIAPYSRFVRSESERLGALDAGFKSLRAEVEGLRHRINAALPKSG